MNAPNTRGREILQMGRGARSVMVMHGWLGGASSWSRLWPHLDLEASTYAFVDFRGYGQRKGEPGDFTVHEAATDTLAIIDDLGWDRFALVTHSMGALAAQILLGRVPERVDVLIGVSPVPPSGSPLGERQSVFRAAVTDLDARVRLLAASTGNQHDETWLRQLAVESAESTNPRALHSYLDSWTTVNVTPMVSGLRTPIRVIVGEHDPANPRSRVEKAWGSCYPVLDIKVLSDAGHYPMDENPAPLAPLICEFLREASPQERATRGRPS